jgi:dienelactone hydrolase
VRRRLRVQALASLTALGAVLTGGVAGAGERGWERTSVSAAGRVLATAAPAPQPAGPVLTVVFEGDGAAHDARGRPTADPTPKHPVGLDIARRWPGDGPKAWVGRLCQYVRDRDPACAEADWTVGRFSEAAVAAADAAVDLLKARTGAERVVLAGWSGGGVIAVLVAQRRGDVAGVATFAAPLDLSAWTVSQGLTPLSASHDPAAEGWRGPPPPQVHMLGAFDPVAPPRLIQPAARRLAGSAGVVAVMPEEHACCWPRRAAEAARLLATMR